MINQEINRLVDQTEDWVIKHRRDIHQHPEVATKEYRTSKKIVSILEELGLEVETGYYNTGVAGIIRGAKPGKTIGLRFDMDALEGEEKTGLDFASENEGVMHSCGHDGHIAIGLGVAKTLMELKDQIKGNVKLIFQPAEEDAQNGGGAQYMIEDGILKNPDVSAILGLHIWPDLECGTVGTKAGPIMASSDPFIIDIRGKGAHASLPHRAIDPIVIGAELVSNLQTIISRNIDPFQPAVITIGKFNAGSRYNTIPDQITLEGTIRTFAPETREEIHEKLAIMTKNIAVGLGGEAEVDYRCGYPVTINDAQLVDFAQKGISDLLGTENYIEIERPAPGGEDFAYFAQEVPAAYLWLGYDQEDKEIYPNHSPKFDFDEQILAVGIKVLTKLALDWGRQHG